MDTTGKQLVPWNEISADDVVIPAFGTTLEILDILNQRCIYKTANTTCPFVTRV